MISIQSNKKYQLNTIDKEISEKEELTYLKQYAKLLDSKFRIPGTDMTFGIDPLLGLIPGLGDLIGYGFSAVLLYSAFKKGVKGEVLIKMLGNIGLDALVGMVPILGTVFDFVYKANTRNYQLLTEFVEEDKHSRSAWPFVLGFIGITLLVIFSVVYGVIAFFGWLFSWVGSLLS